MFPNSLWASGVLPRCNRVIICVLFEVFGKSAYHLDLIGIYLSLFAEMGMVLILVCGVLVTNPGNGRRRFQ